MVFLIVNCLILLIVHRAIIGCTIVLWLIVFVKDSHHHNIHQLILSTILLALDSWFLKTKLILMLSALSINSVLTIPLLRLDPVLIHQVAHHMPTQEAIVVVAVLAIGRQWLPWRLEWPRKGPATFGICHISCLLLLTFSAGSAWRHGSSIKRTLAITIIICWIGRVDPPFIIVVFGAVKRM